MASSLPDEVGRGHLLRSDRRPRMAKASIRKADTVSANGQPDGTADADLRKAEMDGIDVRKAEIGQAVDRARTLLRWSLKELAAAVQRDERQVKRWIDGLERPQFDALFGVPALRGPLVQALAEIADSEDVQVYTEIRIRRAAS